MGESWYNKNTRRTGTPSAVNDSPPPGAEEGAESNEIRIHRQEGHPACIRPCLRRKKVGKLDRYFSSEAEAAITFSVEKDRNRAEVTVRSGSMILRASESTSDMRASIDAAVSTIERQIRKNKARLEKRLRKDAFERSVDVAEVSDFVPEEEEEFRIERVKRFPIKPMTQEEAILQMNLVDHAFFAFKNEDAGGAFSVVYKRENGGYGLIEDAL